MTVGWPAQIGGGSCIGLGRLLPGRKPVGAASDWALLAVAVAAGLGVAVSQADRWAWRPRAARPRPGRPCGPPPKVTPTVVASDAGLSHLMRGGSNRQVKRGQRRQPPALAWPPHVAAMSSLATGTPRLEEANTDNSRCSHAARRVFAPNAIRGPCRIPGESPLARRHRLGPDRPSGAGPRWRHRFGAPAPLAPAAPPA